MRNVLVPVDFSDISINAVNYATKMFTGIYGVNMTLYHMYEKAEHASSAGQQLKKLRKDLFDIGVVKTQEYCEPGHDLVSNIEKFVQENKTDAIVMGITGRNKIEQAIIGSNTLNLIKKNLCPVLIVPPGAKFNKLKHIALATDFIHAPSAAVSKIIKQTLSDFFAKLHIVNVNPAHNVTIPEAYEKVKDETDELFKGYEREFHFIGLYDLPETMNMFVKDHDVDVIITMPKDHSWFNALIGNSNTKRMGYQSTVPVLAIHQ